MSMKMKAGMRFAKLYVLFLLFCPLTINVIGQNKLDDVVISNSEIEQEIISLKEQLSIFNDSINHIETAISADSITLKSAIHDKDSLDLLNSDEYLSALKAEVDSLDSIDNSMLQEIAEKEKDLEAKRKELANAQTAMSDMDAFTAIKKKNQFDENMQYTKKRFSQMDTVQLADLLENSQEFSDMEHFDEYVKRLHSAISNMAIYTDGNRAIDSPFDEKFIISVRARIIATTQVKKDNLKAGVFKLTPEQFSELDSLDIKLSRFKGGLKVLKNIIADINSNEQIITLRATKSSSKRSQLINLIKPYVMPEPGTDRFKNYERYFKMVPYLEKELKQYWIELKSNPFSVPTKTESKIENTVIEEKL